MGSFFSSRQGWLAAAAALVPVAVYAWAAWTPGANPLWLLPSEHFFMVTAVALLAVGVALLVARVALQMEQLQVLLLSLGFLAVAGFFLVHALSTPGVAFGQAALAYAYPGTAAPAPAAANAAPAATPEYGGTVVGLSAFLSLFVAALLFGASYTSGVIAWLKERVPVPPGGLVLSLVALVAIYGVMGLARGEWVARLPVSSPPGSWLLAGISVALFGYAAWRQARTWQRTRLPMHAALVVAFLLLAEAQVLMVATDFWTATWWGYHFLMLVAVILALVALFVELDRRRGLERFLPAEVVERIVAGDLLRWAGERRVVTVLFADLRGSTTLAEKLPAEEVMQLMNAYVGGMAQCVFEQGGMLDKYLGDGLMAVFGVVDDGSQGARPALQAALDIRGAMADLNARRPVPLRFGVGIHTGEVVLGTVGIPQRADFTAIGDTVNTASRMEGLCKELEVDLALSESTASRLPPETPRLRPLGQVAIRGRDEPVQVFTVPAAGAAPSLSTPQLAGVP